MQSAVSRVTVGEEVQLVFCNVNFNAGGESGGRRDERHGRTAELSCSRGVLGFT